MRSTLFLVTLILVFSTCAPCSAQGHVAYMLRYEAPFNDTELVRMDLPSEYTWDPVEPIVVGPLGTGYVSSMVMSPSGELLALDYDGDRLLEINIETGAANLYVDLDIDIEFESGITFDDSGQLWLMNNDSGCFLYHLNPQTGETSFVTQLESWVSQIAVHNGTVYGGRGSEFIEIDTTTGDFTTLMNREGNEWGCDLTALHSNQTDCWGIWACWSGVGGGNPELDPAELVTFIPLDIVVTIAIDDDNRADQPFALVVVTQPPPTVIPALTTPGLIAFGFLLAGAGFLIARYRLSG